MVEVRCRWAHPLLRSAGQPVRSGPLSLHGQSPLATRARTAEPEGTRPVGAYATTHPPMASSGPYLPSLSLAPSARHHLRQEPDAGNPPVRICAGGTEKSVSLPRRNTPGAKHRITAPHRQAAPLATHAVALACPTRDEIALELTPIPAA